MNTLHSFFKIILSTLMPVLFLYACSSSNEPEEPNPIVGTWTFSDNSKSETYEFEKDKSFLHISVSKKYSSNTPAVENGSYEYDTTDGTLTLFSQDGGSNEYHYEIDGDQLSLISKTGDQTTIFNRNENTNTQTLKSIVGIWTFENYPHQYFHFLKDGNGYRQSNATSDNESIYRRAFTWKYQGYFLIIDFKTYKDVYEVTPIGSEKIKIKDIGLKNNGIILNRTSEDGTTNVAYTEPPFEGYILYNGDPYRYYPLYSAIERVDHAKGTDSNSLSLTFLGSNNQLKPNGGYIVYYTPYYEGIPSSWENGTYTIQPGNYWVVMAAYMYVNGSDYGGGHGTLTVSKNKYLSTYDVKTKDITIHFSGERK